MTSHQENAPTDTFPPGLGPRRVIFGGIILDFEGRGDRFGHMNCRANAETVPRCTVGGRCTLSPEVVVHLKEKEPRGDELTL